MNDIVIVAARRTPFGRHLGAAAGWSAVDLGVAAARAALAGFDPLAIDLAIVGNVLGAGVGMNIARQIALRVGLPQAVPAFSITMMCASGLQAVALAAQAIRAGEAEAVLCGGAESMSNAPLIAARAPAARPCAGDTLLCDGLVDPSSGEHMALTAERLAERYAISRDEQDEFAARSHRAWAAAVDAGAYAGELAPIEAFAADEHPRRGIARDKLAALKPLFRADGTITAGNASGINDGAAMLVVADATTAARRGWPALARIAAASAVGCDPALMGLGPVHAIRRLRERHGVRIEDCDAIELNEAFAAQALACIRELGLDPARVNPDGGAIALGHPIGASGARLVVHLARRLAAGAGRRGVAALCVGGGMGVAMALEATAGKR